MYRIILGGTLALLTAANAQADDERFAIDPGWKAECGSCHVAYPPQLLPAASWRAIFAGLADHFGTDASLEPASADALLDYAQAHAARDRGGKPPLRISDTRWFADEHDEVPRATWSSAKVGSPANCSACHTRAEAGDFDERTLKTPR